MWKIWLTCCTPGRNCQLLGASSMGVDCQMVRSHPSFTSSSVVSTSAPLRVAMRRSLHAAPTLMSSIDWNSVPGHKRVVISRTSKQRFSQTPRRIGPIGTRACSAVATVSLLPALHTMRRRLRVVSISAISTAKPLLGGILTCSARNPCVRARLPRSSFGTCILVMPSRSKMNDLTSLSYSFFGLPATFQSFSGALPCAVKTSTDGPPWNAPANMVSSTE